MRRLIGADGNFGQQIGLQRGWAMQAVKAVGNYSEIFERNLGTQSKLGIPRGVNQKLAARRHPLRPADPLRREAQGGAPGSSSVGNSQRLWMSVAAIAAWPMATTTWSRPDTTSPAA